MQANTDLDLSDPCLKAAIDYRCFTERGYGQLIHYKLRANPYECVNIIDNLQKNKSDLFENLQFFPLGKYCYFNQSTMSIVFDNEMAEHMLSDNILKFFAEHLVSYVDFARIYAELLRNELPAFIEFIKCPRNGSDYCQIPVDPLCPNLNVPFDGKVFKEIGKDIISRIPSFYEDYRGDYRVEILIEDFLDDTQRDYSLFDEFDQNKEDKDKIDAIIDQYNQADCSTYRDFFNALKRIPPYYMYKFDKLIGEKYRLPTKTIAFSVSQETEKRYNKTKETKETKEIDEGSPIMIILWQFISDTLKQKAGAKLETVIMKYFNTPEFNERFSDDAIFGNIITPDLPVGDLLQKNPNWIHVISVYLLHIRNKMGADEKGLFSSQFMEYNKEKTLELTRTGFSRAFRYLPLPELFRLDQKGMQKLYNCVDDDDTLDDFVQILIENGIDENEIQQILDVGDENHEIFTNDTFCEIMHKNSALKKDVCTFLYELDAYDSKTLYLDLMAMQNSIEKSLRRTKFRINRNQLISKLLGEIDDEEDGNAKPEKDETLEDFLMRIGIKNQDAYKKCLAEDIELTALYDLDDNDLKELGFNMGQRKKILKSVSDS